MINFRHLYIVFTLLLFVCSLKAQTVPFTVAANLFNQSNTVSLDLSIPEGTETISIFQPKEATDHFSNGVAMISFKDALYCMWQSSAKDEDATDTWVAYSRSEDEGKTWSAPSVLCPTLSNGYCSSGGWIATEDTLIGFINTWPANVSPRGGYTRYVASTDGLTWSNPANVLMADGSVLNGIFEQDPHVLPSGRIVNAAHFQPGLIVAPIYTDDPTGVRGWKKASYTNVKNGETSQEMEPSLFMQADGTLVMIFRDQNSTYYKLAAYSTDQGESFSKAVQTKMPDARTKQSAGNLPDGTAYMAGNPVTNKTRLPLALTLSKDGKTFDKAYLLRAGNDIQTLRYEGSAKRAGFHYPKSMVYKDFLYVAYATNKEDVEYTKVPLSAISLNAAAISEVNNANTQLYVNGGILHVQIDADAEISIFNLTGQMLHSEKVYSGYLEYDMTSQSAGVYMVRITMAASKEVKVMKVILR